MGNIDRWVSGLTFVGVLLFMFLNPEKVTQFFAGTANAATSYVGGIATIGNR